MPFPSGFLERLKSANPIAEVMGEYVTAKRAGRDYVCLCPFHNEKTPSCYIHPDREYFHCFGCGAGGDVITFTMKYHNLDYMEAVKKLAERAGIEMPQSDYQYNGVSQDAKKRMYEMNRAAAKFFYSQLSTPQGAACVRYLRQTRGLSVETIKRYGIGFAPNSWSALKEHMSGLGYSENELISAGLISRSKNNTKKSFDFFVDRAMFPFISLTGNIVGFGGRTLGDDKRKYLNSPDTPIFNKNKFLFSMNIAKNTAVKSGEIILCEGNVDVITLTQAGYENAVASCGTALTAEQAKMISNYAKKAVICYDSDEAGIKAAQRAIDILSAAGLKVSVMRLKGAKDPDEYIKRFGAAAFGVARDKAKGAVEYRLALARENTDMSTEIGKMQYKDQALRIISKLDSAVEREIFARKLADELGVSYTSIDEEIKNGERKAVRREKSREALKAVNFSSRNDRINRQAAQFPGEAAAEEMIIAYIYDNPDQFSAIREKLPPEKFVTDFNRRVYEFISEVVGENNSVSLSEMNVRFTPDEIGAVTRILERCKNDGITYECAMDCVERLMSFRPKQDVSKLNDDDFRRYREELAKKRK